MASTYRIKRSDGVVIVTGLDATDASLTMMDAPPSATTYTYTLELYSNVVPTRTMSMITALLVKK